MKILILGPAYPFRGGIAAFNERLAREFIQEGHDVSIETFTMQYPDFLFPGKTQFSEDPPPPGLEIRRSVHSINPLNWVKTGLRLKEERPDLVVVRFWIPFIGPSLGSICRMIRSNGHSMIIGLTDNIIPHERKPGDHILTSWFINSCDAIVAMSDSVLADLDRFDRKKPRRCGPHPIYDHYGEIMPREAALSRLDLDPECNYLLFFGLIRDYKGLDLLIKALASPKAGNHNIRLLVAGEFYSNEETYRKLVSDLGLEKTVIFASNYIPNEEVQLYFNAADMVVQPYRSATQSGVTQVAYHFHKAMLVTNVGGLPEIVPHGKAGYVCHPESDEIAECIDDFYRLNRKESFEAHVVKEKTKFSWDRFTKLFYDLNGEFRKAGNRAEFKKQYGKQI